MRLLAIDTATEACSVALADGDAVHARWVEAPREHGDRLFGMIEAVLGDAGLSRDDLDGIAFGRGPGAFTGVRIAVSVVQGVAFGLGLRVVGVSTLAALAQGAALRHGVDAVLPAIDARMGEVYWGAYRRGDDGLVHPMIEEEVARPDAVTVPEGAGWHGVGTGWSAHGEALAQRLGNALAADHGRALPDARDMLPLARAAWARGEAVEAEHALPVYLRDRVADRPRQR